MKDAIKENIMIFIGMIWVAFNIVIGVLSKDIDFIILALVILSAAIAIPVRKLIKHLAK